MKYFLHDTNSFQDEKITELFINYGYEGLGLFYTILEKLALQEKPIKTVVLKRQLNVGKKLEKVWTFLESIDLISSNNGETFNIRINSYLEIYTKKRNETKKRVSQHRENQDVTDNVTRYSSVTERVRNTPKLKESKVNKDKVNRSKVNKEERKEEFDAEASFSEDVSSTLEEQKNAPERKVAAKESTPALSTQLRSELEKEYPANVWGVKEGTAMKQIGDKLRLAINQKNAKEGKPECTNEDVINAFKVMLNRMPNLSAFYQFQDVPKLNANFNAIINQLSTSSNGRKPATNGRQSDSEFVKEVDDLIKLRNSIRGNSQ